jgi:hypothetical protein
MRQTRTIPAAALMALLAAPTPVLAADDASLQSVRQEVAKMRADYEARIQDLEKRLAQTEVASTQATTTADAAKKTAEEAAKQPAPGTLANGFNPAIGVVLNGTASTMKRDPAAYRIPGFSLGAEGKPVDRGFALGESEINMSANIDQALYGNLTVSYARDNTFSVEEAFIQSTTLPGGFTLRGGRFKSGIGYLNGQHAHTWDFADAPLPYLTMLNGQYGDDGAQVRWLAPTKMFIELGSEAFRGDAYPANGSAYKGVGTWSAFAHMGDDIGKGGEGGSWRVGVSELWTRAEGRTIGSDTFTGNNRLTIVDGVYKWAPNGNFADRYVKLQGEYFYRSESGRFNDLADNTSQQGFYAQAIWQFMPQWRTGVRYDRVWASAVSDELAASTLDPQGHVGSRQSVMLDYSTSEFGRFRLQGNLDHSTTKLDPQLILQYTMSLGAHGAHAY